MATPLYKLFFFKPTGKALELSQEERAALLKRLEEPGERWGVRLLIAADMRWSSETYDYFGVELFPSQEAAYTYASCLREIGWYDYIEAQSYLGIPMDGTANNLAPIEPPAPGDSPVYRVYFSRLTPEGMKLTLTELQELSNRSAEASRENGGRAICSAYMRWNNEEWEYFGVERYPNMEAVVRYSQHLTVSGWYRYWSARSFLGTGVEGLLLGEGLAGAAPVCKGFSPRAEIDDPCAGRVVQVCG